MSLVNLEKFGNEFYWSTFENPNFHLVHELGNINKSSREQHPNILLFNLCVNWEEDGGAG